MADQIAGAVQAAAKAEDVATLTRFVADHGGPAVRLDGDPGELTALHWAAASGGVDAVNFLLAPPVLADARAARINDFTPLNSAAMLGHAAVYEVLLEAGADVNAQTRPQGYAPLHSAAFAGHVEAIRVLLAHGADRGLLNYRGERAADTARRTGQVAALQVLESQGV